MVTQLSTMILLSGSIVMSDQLILPYIELKATPTEPDRAAPRLEMTAAPLQRNAISGPIRPLSMAARVVRQNQKPVGKPKNRR